MFLGEKVEYENTCASLMNLTKYMLKIEEEEKKKGGGGN